MSSNETTIVQASNNSVDSSSSIIGNYLYGWEHLEPIILGCVAGQQNIMFIGSHGTGKTSLARFLSVAVGEDSSFIKYAMDKENLLSMVGCPNPTSLREGKLDYATHERSVFHADVMLMDEITRATKENQNMVLEILEERTVFGKSLKYKFAVATANNESYKGAMKLDAALLDRFIAVIPVPSPSDEKYVFGPDEIKEMIMLNVSGRKMNLEKSNARLVNKVEKISKIYKELLKSKSVVSNVVDFSAKFFSIVLTGLKEVKKGGSSSDVGDISNRQIAVHFWKTSLMVSAYFKSLEVPGEEDETFLQKGVWEVIQYALATKLGYPIEKLAAVYEELKELLIDGDSLEAKINIATTTGSVEHRVVAVKKYVKQMEKLLEYDDKVNIIGGILQEADMEDDAEHIFDLYDVIIDNNFSETCQSEIMFRLFDVACNDEKAREVLYF